MDVDLGVHPFHFQLFLAFSNRLRKQALGLLGVLAVALSAVPWANAQIGPPSDYVEWAFSVENVSAGAGRLAAHVRITDGWKMYAMDSPRPSRGVTVSLDKMPEGVAATGDPYQVEPRDAFDPNFQIDVRYFVENAAFFVDLVFAGNVDAESRVSGTVTYQICNDELGICLPPTPASFVVPLDGRSVGVLEDCLAPEADGDCEVTDLAGAGDADVFSAGSAIGPSTPPGGADMSGMMGFLLLAAGAGLAALLTPCVFPMIPLTVSYFTRHASDRREAARMATVYGVAIVTMFTGLGVAMALAVGAAGAQTIAANPWVNLFIASVLIAFALSLLGLYELRLPMGLVNYFDAKGRVGGYSGVLFMGFTLTLVSFSCTAPFVGGLLAAAAGGEWFYPLIGMAVFSGAFAMPFVLLSLFPNALTSLPRSGAWMNAFKVTLGFIELAAAIKFLSNADLIWQWEVVSRPLAIAATVVIFALAGLYLIGKLPLAHEPVPAEVGVGRLSAALVFFAASLYMLPGLFGAPLNSLDAYLPPRQATDVSLWRPGSSERMALADSEDWIEDDLDMAMQEARAAGKPLFIDFTGYTCTNCREMESNVFIRNDVAERFERNYVRVRLFTDGLEHGSRFQRYQLRLTGTVALPTYAVVDPAKETLVTKASGVMSADDFIAFLDKGTAGFLGAPLALGTP